MTEVTAIHCDSAADGQLRSSCEANRRHSVSLPAGQDTQPLLHREVRRITRPLSRRAASGPYVWPTPLARIATDAPTLPKPALRQTRLAPHACSAPPPAVPACVPVPALFPLLGERPHSFVVMLPESEPRHRHLRGRAFRSTPHCGLRLFFESLTSAIPDSKAEVDPRFRIPSKTSRSSSEPGDSHN